ncbi:MAG: acylphosphatase [Nitrososphaerota archaeon]|nr:acylphosphatase [Nitrososphaerota archaeon]
MALIAKKISVSGRVQRVGYRRYVLEAALDLGVSGYVSNEPDGSVSVFVQGEEGEVGKFVKNIGEPSPPASVIKIAESEARTSPRVKHFKIRYGRMVEELDEGFGSMEVQFRDYRQEFRGFHDEFRDYRQEFGDYKTEFRGFAARTDENFNALGDKYGEISAKLTQILETLQRQGESFQKEFADTRRDLTRAVDNLSRLIDEYIAKLHEQPQK